MRNEHSSNKMSSGLQNAGQWLHFLFLIIIGGAIGLAIYGVKTWVDALNNPQEIVIENDRLKREISLLKEENNKLKQELAELNK